MRIPRTIWLASVLAILAACSGFKEGEDTNAGAGGGTTADGGTSSSNGNGTTDAGGDGRVTNGGSDPFQTGPGGGPGPGPLGAMSTGYCCNDDSECRYRRCIPFGGAKICSDVCHSDDSCNGIQPGYHCVGATPSDDGHCEPIDTGFKCIPAQDFHYGSKPIGACCTPTFDARSGLECQGGHCDAWGPTSNPYICTNPCSKQSDCPLPNMACQEIYTGYSQCMKITNDVYTCSQ